MKILSLTMIGQLAHAGGGYKEPLYELLKLHATGNAIDADKCISITQRLYTEEKNNYNYGHIRAHNGPVHLQSSDGYFAYGGLMSRAPSFASKNVYESVIDSTCSMRGSSPNSGSI